MNRPLQGIKVLDFTHGVAGPYCTMVLADLGCDVIKIEMPDRGDPTRYMNVSDRFSGDIPNVGGDYFLAINRSKRSVAVDMKTPGGLRACRELAKWADVAVQNFRPGVMSRIGLGYEELKTINPRLIYANISAYGGGRPTKAGRNSARRKSTRPLDQARAALDKAEWEHARGRGDPGRGYLALPLSTKWTFKFLLRPKWFGRRSMASLKLKHGA